MQLLQRCKTPFGKRLFRIWVSMPLTSVVAINLRYAYSGDNTCALIDSCCASSSRLDAVQDLMEHTSISETFSKVCRNMPDMERIISRVHAGKCKQADFLKLVQSFKQIQSGFETMLNAAKHYKSTSIASLLEGAPDISSCIEHLCALYHVENSGELPSKRSDLESEVRIHPQ